MLGLSLPYLTGLSTINRSLWPFFLTMFIEICGHQSITKHRFLNVYLLFTLIINRGVGESKQLQTGFQGTSCQSSPESDKYSSGASEAPGQAWTSGKLEAAGQLHRVEHDHNLRDHIRCRVHVRKPGNILSSSNVTRSFLHRNETNVI